jgi:hypothetical protein
LKGQLARHFSPGALDGNNRPSIIPDVKQHEFGNLLPFGARYSTPPNNRFQNGQKGGSASTETRCEVAFFRWRDNCGSDSTGYAVPI